MVCDKVLSFRGDVAGKDLSNVKIFCVGDKSRGFFQRFLKVSTFLLFRFKVPVPTVP